jgi:AmmeMemoRadiSam system protein A
VGYASIAVIEGFKLNEKEKEELLDIANKTLENHVKGKKVTLPKVKDSYLMKPGASFVTLKKHGELRGCIGQIVARRPLALDVQENTIAAASHDPRFPPVKPDELRDISTEVSVLTPAQPVYDPHTVVVGRDGLIIEKGRHRGVLLPQVPGEAGWSLSQYLDGICRKAGISTADLRDHETKLYRFQALVFPGHD